MRENLRVLLALALFVGGLAWYLIYETGVQVTAMELAREWLPGLVCIGAIVVGAVACSALGKKR